MFDIRSLTWDEWSYPEGVILPIVTLGSIRPKDSGAVQNATEFQHHIAQGKLKSPAVWACLGVYPLDMPRTQNSESFIRLFNKYIYSLIILYR